MKTTVQNEDRTMKLVLCALFAAIITVCSWLTIPAAVPFTMQTFAVFAALLMLGGKWGTLSVAVYLLIGAIGVPVFANFGSGLGTLFGATGGYLIGFLFTGMLYWLVTALCGEKLFVRTLALCGGLLLCYAFGTGWFVMIYTNTKGAVSVGAALGWCVLPFVVPDIVKLSLALMLTAQLKKQLKF